MANSNTSRYFFGTVLLCFGLVLLLDVFLYIPNHIYFVIFSLKNLLILLGVFLFIKNKQNLGSLFLIGIGIFLHIIDFFDVDLTDFTLPIFLIGLGIYLLSNRKVTRKEKLAPAEPLHIDEEKTEPSSSSGNVEYIDQFSFLGSYKQVYGSRIMGGKVRCILANTKVDLTHSQLHNHQIVLDLSSIFGNVDIYIPKEWALKSKMTVILGSFTDNAHHLTNLRLENQDLVILNGVASFGSVKVYRV